MKTRDPYLIRRALTIISYEYGKGTVERLMEGDLSIEFNPVLNRVRQVYYNGELAFSIRASDGYLLPTLLGARFIDSYAVVRDEAVPFIRQGRNVPLSMVIDIINARAGMDIAIKDQSSNVIGVGRLMVSPSELRGLGRGFIIRTRQHLGSHAPGDAVNR